MLCNVMTIKIFTNVESLSYCTTYNKNNYHVITNISYINWCQQFVAYEYLIILTQFILFKDRLLWLNQNENCLYTVNVHIKDTGNDKDCLTYNNAVFTWQACTRSDAIKTLCSSSIITGMYTNRSITNKYTVNTILSYINKSTSTFILNR